MRCRRAVDPDLIGVLLWGRKSELPVAKAACTLAGERRRSLFVVLVRPFVFRHGAMQANLDPDRVAHEIRMRQRCDARELLEAGGLRTSYSIATVRRPGIVAGVGAAVAAGCGSLVLPRRRLGGSACLARMRRPALMLIPITLAGGGWAGDAPELARGCGASPRPTRAI